MWCKTVCGEKSLCMLFLYLKFQKIISKFEKYEDTETQRKCFNKDRNKTKCIKERQRLTTKHDTYYESAQKKLKL